MVRSDRSLGDWTPQDGDRLALEQGVQDEAWAGLGSPMAQGRAPGMPAPWPPPCSPPLLRVCMCPSSRQDTGRWPGAHPVHNSLIGTCLPSQDPASSSGPAPGSRRTAPVPDSSVPKGPRSPVQAPPVVAGCLEPQDRKDSDGRVEGRHAVHQRNAHRVPPAVVPAQTRTALGPQGGGLGQGAASQSPPHHPARDPSSRRQLVPTLRARLLCGLGAGASWGPWVWVPGLQV